MRESVPAIAVAIGLGALFLYLLIKFAGFIIENPALFAGFGLAAVAAGSYFMVKRK